ncbi:MAG: dethiobiotin synthase [Pseudanabaena sp. ELA607]
MPPKPSAQAILIVGTDTGVGKTSLTAALAAYWCQYYNEASLGIYKPIQSGVGDREFYHATFPFLATNTITPLWFSAPLAPAIAAAKEGKTIDLAIAWQGFQNLVSQKKLVLVETLGGLGSPITFEYLVADLARDWQLETILVVPVRLGSIGQAVANVALARQSKVKLKGIVLNCLTPDAEAEISDLIDPIWLEQLVGVPVLGVLPYNEPLQKGIGERSSLASAAANLDLEYLGLRPQI